MDRQANLWSNLDLRFVSFYKPNYISEKMYAKWNEKALHSAKSPNNIHQYSIHLHLCMMHQPDLLHILRGG